jgi:hypothetical protein
MTAKHRRPIVLGVVVALAVPAAAMASSYDTGRFGQGHPRGLGLGLTVKQGSFTVRFMAMPEKCSNGNHASFTITRRAHLKGTIDSTGHLSLTTSQFGGKTTMTGSLSGSTGTVLVKDHGPEAQHTKVTCRGKHTFHIKRK